jgi:hypothetical protein
MPLQLAAPLEQTFTLDISDEKFGTDGEPTKVTIKQATQGAIERRSMVYSEVTNVIGTTAELSAEMQLRQKWSIEELKRIEVFLTMIGCDITQSDGTPLFHFRTVNERTQLDMNENQFKAAWSRLDPIIAAEIHTKVVEVNPDWGGPLER